FRGLLLPGDRLRDRARPRPRRSRRPGRAQARPRLPAARDLERPFHPRPQLPRGGRGLPRARDPRDPPRDDGADRGLAVQARGAMIAAVLAVALIGAGLVGAARAESDASLCARTARDGNIAACAAAVACDPADLAARRNLAFA